MRPIRERPVISPKGCPSMIKKLSLTDTRAVRGDRAPHRADMRFVR